MIVFLPEFKKDTSAELLLTQVSELMNLEVEFVYVKKEPNPLQQQQFLYAVHVADIVIVDCTIPPDNTIVR